MSPSADGQRVGECGLEFVPDELDGFEKATLQVASEGDGELTAALVRTVREGDDRRPAVIYLHGFVDYFFQTHLARAFEDAGFRFYALELRRYGRALRQGNRPCFARSIEDYFEELDWAVGAIKTCHPRIEALVAHSTGGLIAALYLDDRKADPPVERLILNSPFLRFPFRLKKRLLAWFVVRAARFAPTFVLPQTMDVVYGKTLHKDYGGEWEYDLAKKPVEGFPLYAGWFRMIRRAHARVAKGLSVPVPVLVLHSNASKFSGSEVVDADRCADIVLNVEHMKMLGPKLGENVTLLEIPGGVHDLILSRKQSRDLALRAMIEFAKGATLAGD